VTAALIRPMDERDIPRILEIECVSFSTPWTEGMFRSQLRFRDRVINIVLLEGEAIAGYAAAWAAPDEIHLLSIAVAPERRRAGLGEQILRTVLERGKERGAVRVILEVREGNEAAKSFYRRFGFSEIGKRRMYYSDTGEDAIIMEFVFGK
jgi:ribosomal-protein-alanine N-acetyltransferase